MPLDLTIAILDPDDVLLELGLPESEYLRVERLINVASARLERECQRYFKKRQVTKTLTGSPHPLLEVGAPIVSVEEVKVGGTTLPPATYQVLAERGELYRDGGWATGSGFGGAGVNNVEVTATFGYDPIPPDVAAACLWLVRFYRENEGRLGLASERVTEYSYQRAASADDLPGEVRTLIAPFKRWL